jgi:hypothetical protein
VEEPVLIFTTGLGSDEFIDKDFLLQKNKSWWWSSGHKQEVSPYPDSKMASTTAHLP